MLERKTGVLTLLRRDPPREGCLYIVAGRVHDARLGGRTALRRADAVYELLRWDAGRFEFVGRPLELRDEVGLTTGELLLEGARRIDNEGPRQTASPATRTAPPRSPAPARRIPTGRSRP